MRPNQWKFLALLAALLLLPHFCERPWHGITLYGPPRLMGGDEPAYMLMISSLMEDGDLDLSNNYAAQLNGSWEAGENYAGTFLGHHTVWYESTTAKTWSDFYDGDHWNIQGPQRTPSPKVLGVDPLPNQAEYCIHPPGMVLAIAPILCIAKPIFALLGIKNGYEPLAIICSGIEIILAAFFFLLLINKYVSTPWIANSATAIAFLGTPAWHYGRSLFSEPVLVLCATGAYSIALRNKGKILPGVLLGIGILAKPPFLLLGIPLVGYLLLNKDFKGSIRLMVPMGIASLGVLWFNAVEFGGPFRTPIPWSTGSLIGGISGLLFSPDHGLFAFSPIAVFALVGWPMLFRRYRADATALAIGFGLYFLLMSAWTMWWGGFCYGPRLIMPVIPLFLIPVAMALEKCISWWSRSLFWTLASVSILINFFGAVPYWVYWGNNPACAFLTLFFPNLILPVRP